MKQMEVSCENCSFYEGGTCGLASTDTGEVKDKDDPICNMFVLKQTNADQKAFTVRFTSLGRSFHKMAEYLVDYHWEYGTRYWVVVHDLHRYNSKEEAIEAASKQLMEVEE